MDSSSDPKKSGIVFRFFWGGLLYVCKLSDPEVSSPFAIRNTSFLGLLPILSSDFEVVSRHPHHLAY